ncbi:MAG: aldehyde dehydrogenase family protein, partial [Burkholderiaceae bacterium]
MGASLELREATLLRSQGFVAGQWLDAADGRTFEVQDPATGETLVRVANMGATETTAAIDAAQAALGDWKRRPA